jgi:hypothetical protein
VVSYVIILVADFAPWAQKVQTLENLFYFSMHFFGWVSRQALWLDAAPVDLSGDTGSAVKAVAVLALHRVGLNDIVTETTDKEIYGGCHRCVLAHPISFRG